MRSSCQGISKCLFRRLFLPPAVKCLLFIAILVFLILNLKHCRIQLIKQETDLKIKDLLGLLTHNLLN